MHEAPLTPKFCLPDIFLARASSAVRGNAGVPDAETTSWGSIGYYGWNGTSQDVARVRGSEQISNSRSA